MVCSRVVLALITLIAPLNYYGDFRPFFTIYDPDCAAFTKKPQARSSSGNVAAGRASSGRKERQITIPAMLGVTNPHFDQVNMFRQEIGEEGCISPYQKVALPVYQFYYTTRSLFPLLPNLSKGSGSLAHYCADIGREVADADATPAPRFKR